MFLNLFEELLRDETIAKAPQDHTLRDFCKIWITNMANQNQVNSLYEQAARLVKIFGKVKDIYIPMLETTNILIVQRFQPSTILEACKKCTTLPEVLQQYYVRAVRASASHFVKTTKTLNKSLSYICNDYRPITNQHK